MNHQNYSRILVNLILAFLLVSASIGPAFAASAADAQVHTFDTGAFRNTGQYHKDVAADNMPGDPNPIVSGKPEYVSDSSPADEETTFLIDVDPCFERFSTGSSKGFPAGFREIDTLTYTGAGPDAASPAILRDPATGTVIALYGKKASPAAKADVQDLGNGIVWIDCAKGPQTYDYAVISFPDTLFPDIKESPLLVRIEDDGQVFGVPTHVEGGRVYAATTEFCHYCTVAQALGVNFDYLDGSIVSNGAAGAIIGSLSDGACPNLERLKARPEYLGGDIATGFVPVVGQITAVRDIIAAVEGGDPVLIVAAGVGLVPLIGKGVGKAAKVIKLERKAGAAAAARAAAAEEKVAESGARAAAMEEKVAAAEYKAAAKSAPYVAKFVPKPGWGGVIRGETIGELKIQSHAVPKEKVQIDLKFNDKFVGSKRTVHVLRSNGDLDKINYYDERGFMKYQYEFHAFDKYPEGTIHVHEWVDTMDGSVQKIGTHLIA